MLFLHIFFLLFCLIFLLIFCLILIIIMILILVTISCKRAFILFVYLIQKSAQLTFISNLFQALLMILLAPSRIKVKVPHLINRLFNKKYDEDNNKFFNLKTILSYKKDIRHLKYWFMNCFACHPHTFYLRNYLLHRSYMKCIWTKYHKFSNSLDSHVWIHQAISQSKLNLRKNFPI